MTLVRLLAGGSPFAGRSCADCARWLYKDDGAVLTRGRERVPVPRPPGTPTPCHECPKVPADAPARTREHAVEPSEGSWRVWRHYRECKAVAWQVPEAADPIVRRHAGLLAPAEEAYAGAPLRQLVTLLLARS